MGDENSRLGFEVHGYVSPDDPTDVDVYSFSGTAGTQVWIDLDRTDPSLDAVLELINASGTLLARSTDMPESLGDVRHSDRLGQSGAARRGTAPGGRLVRHQPPGWRNVRRAARRSRTDGHLFRARPQHTSDGQHQHLKGSNAGQTTGRYQLQIRMQQTDEKPGSTVRYADIRYATTGIDVRGLPAHSPLVGETAERGEASATRNTAQVMGNVLATDLAALNLAGNVAIATDVDWYVFDLNHIAIQSIGGVNDAGKTVAVVFDLDYADGAVRPDATISVFDSTGQLIYVGRESNIADDLPRRAKEPTRTISAADRWESATAISAPCICRWEHRRAPRRRIMSPSAPIGCRLRHWTPTSPPALPPPRGWNPSTPSNASSKTTSASKATTPTARRSARPTRRGCST